LNDAKEKLNNELASMKTILTEKDNEIEWYEERRSPMISNIIFFI
jgi:hypothetical protein